MRNPSERLDGPSLFAFWGNDKPDSVFRFGTREFDWHSHVRGQFFFVENGLVHVQTSRGSWLLPPHRAGWIPPGVSHKIRLSGVVSGWGVLVTPDASQGLPAEPCVVGVSDLMGALVRRAANWQSKEQLDDEQERIVAVLLDEVRRARREPLHLPMPVDHRLLRVAMALLQHPDDRRTLADLSKDAGLSARTARRLFQAETGVTFMRWREQARLSHAMERLAHGDAVASVADGLGYATPSNFIAMFRRVYGEPPGRYFKRRGSSPGGLDAL
ncbi:AraC family transcriptional regulator [Hyphomicrobiales bacterium]|nr:AraC family transcriptional regulator [Hyphomicrobiales bacterium]CAH1695265.1 AraC family transcriptional regulator [Hyphomicrobiales bacterium]